MTVLPPHSHIIFQAYGNEGILHECALALLTFCRYHSPEELDRVIVTIYTDRPDFFERFRGCPIRFQFREISPQRIREWRGEIDFLHRVKIAMLADFLQDHEGQVLYLDTDICFTGSVADFFHHIHHGRRYMHIMEGLVHHSGNVMLRKLSGFLAKNRSLEVNGKALFIPEDIAMWNAGVLGFSSSDKELVQQVLEFTDAVYRKFPKHTVEQFAFSYFFQKDAALLSAHTRISHYWNLKELRVILESFFSYFRECDWEELVRYSILIQLPDPMQQKVNFLQNRSVIGKFRKEQWQPELPRWDLLLQQI